MTSEDLERKYRELKDLKVAATVLDDAGLDVSRRPHARIGFAEMEALIADAKPRVVYLDRTPFSLEDEIETLLAAEKIADPDEAIADRLREALAGNDEHAGKLGSLIVSVFIDGVFHVCIGSAEWYEDFEAHIEQTLVSILEEKVEDAEKATAALAVGIREKAVALLADGRFSAPKATRSKREFLATELFALPPKTIDAIVTEAENLAWMADVAHLAPKAETTDEDTKTVAVPEDAAAPEAPATT